MNTSNDSETDDVLAVMDDAHHALAVSHYYEEADRLDQARAAVANLIKANAAKVVTPEMLAEAFQMEREGGRYFMVEYGMAKLPKGATCAFYDAAAMERIAKLLTDAIAAAQP